MHNLKRINLKKTIISLIVCISIYYAYKAFHPATVVGVFPAEGRVRVVVKDLPFSDPGRLAWWKRNKKMLNEKYGIPIDNSQGHFYITFWDINDGFKEMPEHVSRWSSETTDLLCFEEMKVKKNCIEKDIDISVFNTLSGDILISTDDGQYRQKKNGDIVKAKW